MAKGIGLLKEWFQDNRMLKHYDLTPGKRAVAVLRGAIEHDRKQAIEKWRELRIGPVVSPPGP